MLTVGLRAHGQGRQAVRRRARRVPSVPHRPVCQLQLGAVRWHQHSHHRQAAQGKRSGV